MLISQLLSVIIWAVLVDWEKWVTKEELATVTSADLKLKE